MKGKNLLIIFLSIFLSILFLEIFLRFAGFNKFTTYYSSNYYGYYHEPNQEFTTRFGKLISTDKMGNRNPNKNNLDNSKLFFVGDSVTYGGSIVNNNELFAEFIANRFNKKHLNLSANGWGIPNMINFINFHNLYQKDSTYIIVCIIDCFTRNLRKLEQNFFFKSKSKFALINFFKLIFFQINNLNNVSTKDSFGSDKRFNLKDNLYTIDYSIKKLHLFNENLKKINSKLIFIYSPNTNYINSISSKQKDYINSQYKDYLLKKINQSNIKNINIIEFFDQEVINNYEKYFIDNVHLSADGHILYSKIIANFIDE